MMRMRFRLLAMLNTACGPQVLLPPDGGGFGEASGGGTDGDASAGGPSSISAAADASSGDFADDGATDTSGVCGNRTVDPGEACDDGNLVDADGCSSECEQSGTVSWRVDFTTFRGWGVGLDARDGEAYVLIQDYGSSFKGGLFALSSRVSTSGEIAASFQHLDAFADPDLSRNAIAAMPGGEIIVGYHWPEASLGRVDFASGLLWDDPLTDWDRAASTRWYNGEVFTLRATADTQAWALLRFTETGEPLEVLWLEDGEPNARPLAVGPMFIRSSPTVFTAVPGSSIQLHSFHGGETSYVDYIPIAGKEVPRAFDHGTETVIWTDRERIVVDFVEHPQPATPRIVPGLILTSFPGRFAVVEDQRIDMYDDNGGLLWSHESPAMAHTAMLDGKGGMFVLSNGRPPVDGAIVYLERIVL